jgi:hypothetical protein
MGLMGLVVQRQSLLLEGVEPALELPLLRECWLAVACPGVPNAQVQGQVLPSYHARRHCQDPLQGELSWLWLLLLLLRLLPLACMKAVPSQLCMVFLRAVRWHVQWCDHVSKLDSHASLAWEQWAEMPSGAGWLQCCLQDNAVG